MTELPPTPYDPNVSPEKFSPPREHNLGTVIKEVDARMRRYGEGSVVLQCFGTTPLYYSNGQLLMDGRKFDATSKGYRMATQLGTGRLLTFEDAEKRLINQLALYVDPD
jgi:hypothetical protein